MCTQTAGLDGANEIVGIADSGLTSPCAGIGRTGRGWRTGSQYGCRWFAIVVLAVGCKAHGTEVEVPTLPVLFTETEFPCFYKSSLSKFHQIICRSTGSGPDPFRESLALLFLGPVFGSRLIINRIKL